MPLNDAVKRLLRRNRKLRGELVTLIINGVERGEVLAQKTKCQLRAQVEGSSAFAPVQIVTDGSDWLIEAGDYYVETNDDEEPVLVEPSSGDRIRQANGDTHEVLPMGMNEECFYYRDPAHEQLRVHSKQVGN